MSVVRINAANVKGALDKNQQLSSAVTIVLTQTQMNCIRLYSDLASVFISVCNCCGVARDIGKD